MDPCRAPGRSPTVATRFEVDSGPEYAQSTLSVPRRSERPGAGPGKGSGRIPEDETPDPRGQGRADGIDGVLEGDQAAADRDQIASDVDQTAANRDQAAADRDQRAAESDQLTADQDQAASDLDYAHGLGRVGYEVRRQARDLTTQARHETSDERLDTALVRDASAFARDLEALARDQAAADRDRDADERDRVTIRLSRGFGSERGVTGTQILLEAARDRKRAADDRARAAAQRAQAARDRELAARDREQAASDREHAARERLAAAVDFLTGAWQRGPGVMMLERDIDRVRRGTGTLTVAYVDVDGLKATNDSQGHPAGDALLTHVVAVMRRHLRSYETIVRMGGDEFLCVMSETSVARVRNRFTEISRDLAQGPDPAAITVGFAELTDLDSASELVARADADLLNTRRWGRAHRDRARGPA